MRRCFLRSVRNRLSQLARGWQLGLIVEAQRQQSDVPRMNDEWDMLVRLRRVLIGKCLANAICLWLKV